MDAARAGAARSHRHSCGLALREERGERGDQNPWNSDFGDSSIKRSACWVRKMNGSPLYFCRVAIIYSCKVEGNINCGDREGVGGGGWKETILELFVELKRKPSLNVLPVCLIPLTFMEVLGITPC